MINQIKKLLQLEKGKIIIGDNFNKAKQIKLSGDISVDENGIVKVLKTISSKIGEYFSL